MSFTAMFSVLKHFGPRWFSAIAQEAQQVPATIAGIFFVWVTIIGVCGFAYLTYSTDAQAYDNRLSLLRTVVEKNTKELNCARQDRRVSAKAREISVTARLLELASNEAEQRQLGEELQSLRRVLYNLETKYTQECL